MSPRSDVYHQTGDAAQIINNNKRLQGPVPIYRANQQNVVFFFFWNGPNYRCEATQSGEQRKPIKPSEIFKSAIACHVRLSLVALGHCPNFPEDFLIPLTRQRGTVVLPSGPGRDRDLFPARRTTVALHLRRFYRPTSTTNWISPPRLVSFRTRCNRTASGAASALLNQQTMFKERN